MLVNADTDLVDLEFVVIVLSSLQSSHVEAFDAKADHAKNHQGWRCIIGVIYGGILILIGIVGASGGQDEAAGFALAGIGGGLAVMIGAPINASWGPSD